MCQRYLDDACEPLLADFLTRYLLIHICAECEKSIKEIIKSRVVKSGDNELVSFVVAKVDVRSLRINDIRKNILKPFSERCVNLFNSKLREKADLESKYQNIVENRNQAAHGGTLQMSFNELRDSYRSVRDVVMAISDAINHS